MDNSPLGCMRAYAWQVIYIHLQSCFFMYWFFFFYDSKRPLGRTCFKQYASFIMQHVENQEIMSGLCYSMGYLHVLCLCRTTVLVLSADSVLHAVAMLTQCFCASDCLGIMFLGCPSISSHPLGLSDKLISFRWSKVKVTVTSHLSCPLSMSYSCQHYISEMHGGNFIWHKCPLGLMEKLIRTWICHPWVQLKQK